MDALRAGTIDIVSSDHCPRTPLADSQPAGVSGIEVRLALVHTFGVRAGLIDPCRWVEVCCTAPARIFGLGRKGRLEPGADADIVLFDPERELVALAGHAALAAAVLELRGDHAARLRRSRRSAAAR